MRWIPFLIFAYLFVLVQTTLGRMITLERLPFGPVGPDFVVLLAVFIAFYVRGVIDGMLAGWTLGILLDLTTGGGPGGITRVGPMAIFFCLCVYVVFHMREAVFRERAVPQILIAALFCFLAHMFWAITQMLLGPIAMSWSLFARVVLQVLLSSIYTGLLMPLTHFILMPCRNWLLVLPPSGMRRSRAYTGRG
jgi:rod shape-determining protein MreD